ncbi:hypothetical protein GWK08_12135 [Leptobacterium flavescens]|uniref:Outer membrane beta-barrel protein n=1 Tax=Leptobacterium flavescens TaxID=472055 RepID=A0A6P0ULT8_9FLAO|nr:DUF6048 family protein [Leptobacterium flavescens]NER14194.1 hypothetical protein [Leptobacterium flavescens]
MSKYFINSILFFSCCFLFAQNQTATDSVVYKEKYGLRIGVDISKLIRTGFDENYSGFELVGDYRVSKRFFAAVELGNEENTVDEDFFNFTSKGSYIKVGFDYNTYENWYGMQNSISAGLRYGLSSFSQTVNSFTINNRNQFFGEGNTPGTTDEILREFDGLSSQWIEAVFAIKAELFNNLYLGASIRLNYLLGGKEEDIFPNLWSPGFNRITQDSKFGIGYNYSITYLIPLYKTKK